MPNWTEVLKEIDQTNGCGGGVDLVRRRYLKKLYRLTGRNVIAY